MTWTANQQGKIIRTERGLTIAGTRTSLYAVIDLLKADYPLMGLRRFRSAKKAQTITGQRVNLDL
jgi:hypothetical protein